MVRAGPGRDPARSFFTRASGSYNSFMEGLNKFLAQFAALYDVNNSQAGQTSPIVTLLGGGQASSNGIINIAPIV